MWRIFFMVLALLAGNAYAVIPIQLGKTYNDGSNGNTWGTASLACAYGMQQLEKNVPWFAPFSLTSKTETGADVPGATGKLSCFYQSARGAEVAEYAIQTRGYCPVNSHSPGGVNPPVSCSCDTGFTDVDGVCVASTPPSCPKGEERDYSFKVGDKIPSSLCTAECRYDFDSTTPIGWSTNPITGRTGTANYVSNGDRCTGNGPDIQPPSPPETPGTGGEGGGGGDGGGNPGSGGGGGGGGNPGDGSGGGGGGEGEGGGSGGEGEGGGTGGGEGEGGGSGSDDGGEGGGTKDGEDDDKDDDDKDDEGGGGGTKPGDGPGDGGGKDDEGGGEGGGEGEGGSGSGGGGGGGGGGNGGGGNGECTKDCGEGGSGIGDGAAYAEVPEFYERKYPEGIAGVWKEKGTGQLGGRFKTMISAFTGFSGDSGGACIQFSMPVDIGIANFGTFDLSPPCALWTFLRAVILISAIFMCRRIIFGG